MSLRQCIHRGTGDGVQLCPNRAPRALSNVARAPRAPREVHHAYKQLKHGTMYARIYCIHPIMPEHYEHYARSDVA